MNTPTDIYIPSNDIKPNYETQPAVDDLQVRALLEAMRER